MAELFMTALTGATLMIGIALTALLFGRFLARLAGMTEGRGR
jgi:hypothetical protein